MRKRWIFKSLLLASFIIGPHSIYSQITYNYTGGLQIYTVPAFVYELTVDMSGASAGGSAPTSPPGNQIPGDGAVQSCVLDKSSSSIVSTPAMMKAKNKILHGLKFAKGYDYPRFHRGHVEINTVQETGSVDDNFSPQN